MKLVLDANIFISAFIAGGKPQAILDEVAKESDVLFITDEIIEEIETVFRRPKFHQTEERIKDRINYIRKISRHITVTKRITTGGSRDTTDNKYLECGIAANVNYIISGDIHLLELKEYRGIKIVKAAEYFEFMGNRRNRQRR